MKKYIRVMRFDHWIKQFFIVPGCVCALLLSQTQIELIAFIYKFVFGFIGISLIASANYTINEWLDAKTDKYHPTKNKRSAVTEKMKGSIIFAIWIALTILGILFGLLVNIPFMIMQLFLWIMGIMYNVKPMRTKDIAILDVLSESINNAIRLLMGWFIVSSTTIPPSSIIVGYWMGGAFLMAIKRFAKYRMINNPELAGQYRKSFCFYTEKSLLVSAFFYAMLSVFFIGIFLVKYRIELILFIPFLMGLYAYYFWISFKDDSAVQKPEKLYKEKWLMLYCIALIALFVILMFIDIPFLEFLSSNAIINI